MSQISHQVVRNLNSRLCDEKSALGSQGYEYDADNMGYAEDSRLSAGLVTWSQLVRRCNTRDWATAKGTEFDTRFHHFESVKTGFWAHPASY
jgi:hypothetical protein